MEIGELNNLIVDRETDFGYYLIDEEENDVLIPKSFVHDDLNIGDQIEVFLYKDSEDRLIATNIKPFATLEEFAWLQVKEVNDYGAFLDWGLPKDLMVPYAEQAEKMEEGKSYLVFILKDEKSDRLIGSAKINRYIYTEDIELEVGEEVTILPYKKTDLGINVIVSNLYNGLIFSSDIHKEIVLGKKIKAFVKQIRSDGKIDIVLEPIGYEKSVGINTEIILSILKENDGFIALTDKTSPEIIKDKLGLSKKAFKKALGSLYKQKLVEITGNGIKLK
jgi:hypothetical protein